MKALRRRVLEWLEAARVPAAVPVPDAIRDDLRAAVAAEANAKAANVDIYKARVEAMIADFFVRYGERDARHHP